MYLLPAETLVLHYIYKHYPTSTYLKNQEEFVLRRGTPNCFYCKAKNGFVYKTTSAKDLVIVSFCAVGNALKHYMFFRNILYF